MRRPGCAASLVALLCLPLPETGCPAPSSGERPAVTGVSPSRVHNDRDIEVAVRGKRLDQVQKVMLWEGTSDRLLKGLSLSDLRLLSRTRLTARLLAGALPGDYRVVLQTGEQTTFSEVVLHVEDRRAEAAPPRVIRVRGSVYTDVPGRLYITGGNLGRAIAVRLVGGARAVDLRRLRIYSGARIGASLPAGALPAGAYRLQVVGRHGTAEGPEVQVSESGHAREARLTFLIYFGVLGTVFLAGLLLTGLQGDLSLRRPEGRRALGLLLAGLVFTFFLLGAVQFALSWWS